MSVLNQDPHGRGLSSSPDFYSDDDEFDFAPARDRRLDPLQPSGSYANDDDPRFAASWRQPPRQEPVPKQRDVLFGVAVGVATAFVVGLLGLIVPNLTGAAGAPISIISILVPSVLLGALSVAMARLKRLSITMERTSRSVEFAQSTIAELDNVRTTFQNEIAFVNQALQMNRNFISTRLNTVKADFEGAAISSARILEGRIAEIAHNFKESVLHDTNIQSNWTALINATDKIVEIVNNTPEQLDKHIEGRTATLKSAIEAQVERLAGQLEALTGNMARNQEAVQQNTLGAIDKIRDHVAAVKEAMNSAVDAGAEKQARKIENVLSEIKSIGNELSGITKSIPQQLSIDMKATEHLIEDVVEKAMKSASAKLDDTISSASRSNAALSEMLSGLPSKLDDYMAGIAPSIAAGINENARRSETRIIEVVKRSVIEGQAQAAQFGPTLEKIGREILDIEGRLRTALDVNRQGVENLVQKLPETVKTQIESNLSGKLNKIEAELKTTIASLLERQDTNSVLVKNQMTHVLDSVQAAVESVNGSVNGMSGSVQDLAGKLMTVGGAIHEIRGAMETAGGSIHEIHSTIQNVGGSIHEMHGAIQNVGGSIHDINQAIHSVGGSINDADHVIKSINAVTAQFRDIVDTRMDGVRESIESALTQFDDAINRQRDALTQSMAGDLATTLASTQNKLAQEYHTIEERLTRSLSNFNDIVQNCIVQLEESVVWRRDSFDEQIRVATEQNLVAVRDEIEQLADRLKSKVAEVSFIASEIPVQRTPKIEQARNYDPAPIIPDIEEDGPDPQIIETLSKKLANIDSILGELRRENEPEFDSEKV